MKQARLREKYLKEVRPQLKKELGYSSIMQVPKILKITINQGVGNGSKNPKILESAQKEMTLIAGQKAVITKSKKAISNFGLREGMPVGVRVTLRDPQIMYEFFDRLITLAIPRIRDFRGLSKRSFDGRGNYTFGIKNQTIFPEIGIETIQRSMGKDITLVTSAKSDAEALALLSALGFPFKKN